MKEIESAYCETSDQFFKCGNGQGIREALLRQAVNSCDDFATDIIIFLGSEKLRELIEDKDHGEISVYFRGMGVDWGYKRSYAGYRYTMRLVKKDKAKYVLYGEEAEG